MLGDPLAERQIALGGGILQRLAGDGGAGKDLAPRLLEQADAEQGRIGNAAGKGNHGRFADELEQFADLGFAPSGVGVPLAALHRLNSAPEQLERALDGLLKDGLAEMHDGGLRLPA